MHRLRLLVFPIVLGLVLGFTGLNLGASPASAQTGAPVTVNCTTSVPSTCTITLNYGVPPGGSFTAILPGNVQVTFNCPGNCVAGTQYTITSPSTGYNSSQVVVLQNGGQCVGVSYLSSYGCSSSYPYQYGGSPYQYGGSPYQYGGSTGMLPFATYIPIPIGGCGPGFGCGYNNGCGFSVWGCSHIFNNGFPSNHRFPFNHCFNSWGNHGHDHDSHGNNFIWGSWSGNHC